MCLQIDRKAKNLKKKKWNVVEKRKPIQQLSRPLTLFYSFFSFGFFMITTVFRRRFFLLNFENAHLTRVGLKSVNKFNNI